MAHIQEWSATKASVAANGISKQTIEGVGVSLVRVTVPAGLSAPKHHHDHEQFVQVLSGTGELETEEGSRPFGPGSIFCFPTGTWHAARFDTETVLVETNLRS
ncbi:MAG: cupin domain-containing protein [Methylobacteriaceae bacterium]|nr:cupin domain-containing protein [Methylobacteriaceae bacterium]